MQRQRAGQEEGGAAIAHRLLTRLLARHEGLQERRNRIIEPMPAISLLGEDRDALYGLLAQAAAAGAVELVYGKLENRHNIEKVILLELEPLYGLLKRAKPLEVAKAAKSAILSRLPDLGSELTEVLERVAEAWGQQRNLIRDTGPEDVETIVTVMRMCRALLGRRAGDDRHREDGMDIRTVSRRATGNSKFLQRNKGRVADVLRMAAPAPEALDADEILAWYGVREFPHPCLIAGPVAYKGQWLPAEPYIGVSPEMAKHLTVAGRVEWILTIENLASFNRQVREAAADGVVIYTGGFPGDTTLDAILALASTANCPVYHWGDIDPGGVKIAWRIERALERAGRPLRLHMMEPVLALRYGMPAKPARIFRDFQNTDSVVAQLVAFLASEEARTLEQEELNPRLPSFGGCGR